MATYIRAAVSHSACGYSATESLQFDSHQHTSVTLQQGVQVPLFAMKGLSLESSEQRLYGTLFTLLEALIDQTGLTPEQLAKTPLLLGSTSLDISLYQPSSDQTIWLPPSDNITTQIVEQFGLSELSFTINTACTASLNALLYGKKLLEQMACEQVLVVGCEFYNALTLGGFYSLDLMSAQGELKAFSEQRDGLIIGEGIGALLLAKQPSADGVCFEILEGYSNCDTHSLTTTQEDGSQIKLVIDKALAFSGLSTTDIDLIKSHGTATYSNDLTESNALRQDFSETPIWALKPFIGHTLGACGVVELALMDYLLRQPALPQPHYAEQSTESLLMPFAQADKPLAHYRHILLNHCGFGGNNSALIVKVTGS